MRNLFNIFLTLTILLVVPGQVVFCDPPPAGGYIYPTPVTSLKWETYLNPKYGFSIQFPTTPKNEPLKPYQNVYAEEEINLPTIYGNDMVRIYTFTDTSVKRWNKGFPDASGEDGEPFEYRMKALYKAIALPVGSPCKALGFAKVVNLNGEKAICFSEKDQIKYFCYRGKTRWIEIDQHLLIYSSGLQGINQINQEQIEAEKVVLKTLKFFDPKD